MYRVFEALDELVQTVDQAYGVPMTANCMVPRNEVLTLLDDLRNALPVEIDDAQDVLDKADSIVHEAEEHARQVIDGAEAEADDVIARAREEAEHMVADAENRANAMVAKAQDDADRLVSDARRAADDAVSRATAEADRLMQKGNDAYQRSVDEGLAEQHRLVSEAEVVRRADEEAHRIVDAAHGESNRLRQECDMFVDGKLAEFEEMLSAALRSVGRDRSALRRGAGATGRDRGSRDRSTHDRSSGERTWERKDSRSYED